MLACELKDSIPVQLSSRCKNDVNDVGTVESFPAGHEEQLRIVQQREEHCLKVGSCQPRKPAGPICLPRL